MVLGSSRVAEAGVSTQALRGGGAGQLASRASRLCQDIGQQLLEDASGAVWEFVLEKRWVIKYL